MEPGTLTGLIEEIARGPEAAEGLWAQGLVPGAVIGRFELVREIGRGGFGVVWEARDRELGRSVAFKAVRAGPRAALRETRLLREAEAAARLSHPNIVTLHDVGRSEHGPFLVLELLRGQTLGERLAAGPLAVPEAVRIAIEVTRGVAHAHAEGVVHRDLKPGNVFLCDDGQVKVLDFGMAHAFGRKRQDGGTPEYMAPEQWKGAPEDERTDVFALGVLLYRLLTGDLPFPADGGKALESSRPAPRLEVGESPALGAQVARMLEKDPLRRPRDGGEVLAALSGLWAGMERTPVSASSPVRARRPLLRRGGTLLAAALALGLAMGIGAGLLRRPAPPAERIAVAVADFANQTGDPELDGLSGMLITSLEQSRRLQVMTRVRMLDVLRQMGKAGVTSVDEALGRELALSAGVRALVLATIRRFDQLYAIELKVLDPVRSEYLLTLQEEGKGKASVPGMIDRLSERARQGLHTESPREIEASRVKVADATTRSFEAWQHYFKGDQQKEAIRYAPALEEYRKAIALDPDFAMPHYRIAYLGQFTGLPEAESKAEMAAAMRQLERVPAKERLMFRAWQAKLDGRQAEAHALYDELVAAWPEDKEALFMAGDLWLHEGRYERGLPFFRRAVALDPAWEPAVMHVADSLAFLGQVDELEQLAREWVARSPGAPAFRALALAHLWRGQLPEAEAAARRALDLDGTAFSREVLGDILVLAGRYRDAEALVRPLVREGVAPGERLWATKGLVTVLAYQGRIREARAVVEELPDDPRPGGSFRALVRVDLALAVELGSEALQLLRGLPAGHERERTGFLLACLGDLGGARQASALLPPGPDRRRIEAAIALRENRAGEAVDELRDLARSADRDMRGATFWLLAEAAAAAGRDAELIEAVEKLRTSGGSVWRAGAWPRSQLLLARAYQRRGEPGKARPIVDGLLEAWKRADAELPMLAEARALRREIGERR